MVVEDDLLTANLRNKDGGHRRDQERPVGRRENLHDVITPSTASQQTNIKARVYKRTQVFDSADESKRLRQRINRQKRNFDLLAFLSILHQTKWIYSSDELIFTPPFVVTTRIFAPPPFRLALIFLGPCHLFFCSTFSSEKSLLILPLTVRVSILAA